MVGKMMATDSTTVQKTTSTHILLARRVFPVEGFANDGSSLVWWPGSCLDMKRTIPLTIQTSAASQWSEQLDASAGRPSTTEGELFDVSLSIYIAG